MTTTDTTNILVSADFQLFLQACQQRSASALEQILPPPTEPASRLKQAMRYSALNGGKRVRATLVYAAAQAVSGEIPAYSDPIACAVELIHAYSLVHDDLPAMDDDALRRGQPTCHIAFDEATAILAGDALQTLAFECIALTELSSEKRCELILALARASGAAGMVAGQDMDLAAEGKQISLPELESLHRHKTGALIRASVQLGAIASNATTEQKIALDNYASAIGLAFQVQDDILDIESSTEQLGKQQGADLALNKSTYPSLLGLETARQRAQDLCDEAIRALTLFDGSAEPLRQLARYIVERKN
ncbi:MAG TPA: (2E,6E)-farnesyl diphosphate synthase [Pseudomonadales bacterium]|nr:(2E,6E)-farnesyl diphosphate synthase [Pseudomonadales bacterium]